MIPDLITWPTSGTYILAVSGGVDSAVLLDLFANVATEKNYQLVVAHFDHKMRPESSEDAVFVENMALRYGLTYLGEHSDTQLINEDAARTARYSFLESSAKKVRANGVITAHHQDDLIETSLLNLARGTGRAGLVPFEADDPNRPLKTISRKSIESYASHQKLAWREDHTNQDISNPRNFIRHHLAPALRKDWVERYLSQIEELKLVNERLMLELIPIINDARIPKGFSFPKTLVRSLSVSELGEVVMTALGSSERRVELDRRLVEELVIFAKTGKCGRHRPVRDDWEMRISYNSVDLRMI